MIAAAPRRVLLRLNQRQFLCPHSGIFWKPRMNANGRQCLGISTCLFAIRIHSPRSVVAQDHPFPLQLGPFEIQKQANLVACDPQIVDHPPPFMVRDGIDYLGINDHGAESNEVGQIIRVHWRSFAVKSFAVASWAAVRNKVWLVFALVMTPL